MENHTNKIYARLNESKIVVELFSSVFEQPLETDILIEEGNEEYHSHIHLKYTLIDNEGRYNYKYESENLVELTNEEKEALFPAPVQKPTEQQILNAKLLQDNANMQLELEQQKQLNAQMLLQIAQLGGNTNV